MARSGDLGQAARGLSRPGIDPRDWTATAIVQEVIVDEDGLTGVYLDVLVQPGGPGDPGLSDDEDGWSCRVKWTCLYAGDGFGMYFPVQVNDQVRVHFPDGNPDGPNVTASSILHNEEDKLPSQVAGDPDTIWLITKSDTHFKILAQGDGEVFVEAKNVRIKGSVLTILGDTANLTAQDGVITGQSIDPFTGVNHLDYSSLVRARKV